MAITDVNRIWVGQKTRAELNGAQTLGFRYRVICDSIEEDTDLQILEDARIPSRGKQFTLRGTDYWVQSVETESPEDNNRIVWHVNVELTDTLDGSGGDLDSPPGGNKPNPMDDAPIFNFGSGDGTKFIRKDIKGNLIVNTAGDPPDPIQVFRPRPVVTFNRNEPLVTWSKVRQFVGKVNKNAWNGAPAGSVLCRSIVAQQRWRNEIPYYATAYQFEFDDTDGWQLKLVSTGYRELVQSTGGNGNVTKTIAPILVNGEPTQEPMALTAAGRAIQNQFLVEGGRVQPAVTDWQVIEEVDFGPLNIILPTS